MHNPIVSHLAAKKSATLPGIPKSNSADDVSLPLNSNPLDSQSRPCIFTILHLVYFFESADWA